MPPLELTEHERNYLRLKAFLRVLIEDKLPYGELRDIVKHVAEITDVRLMPGNHRDSRVDDLARDLALLLQPTEKEPRD